MLNLDHPADRKAYETLRQSALSLEGTNFALAMRNEDDTVTVWDRPNQPCQGGEMRKYGSSHPGDSTRPYDRRPSDLRMPFPEGIPEAVGVHFLAKHHFNPDKYWNIFLRAAYSDDSPYRSAFGSPNSVELLENKEGHIAGVIYHDMNVDSTVLVNSLQYVRSMGSITKVYSTYLENGLSPSEAMMVMMLMTSDPTQSGIANTGTYYFANNASLRRIIEGKPHDLTGGTFRERYDYNRPQVQQLFAAGQGEHATIFKKALEEAGLETTEEYEYSYGGAMHKSRRTKKTTIDEFVAAVRKVVDEAMETSKDEDYSKITLQTKNEAPPVLSGGCDDPSCQMCYPNGMPLPKKAESVVDKGFIPARELVQHALEATAIKREKAIAKKVKAAAKNLAGVTLAEIAEKAA